MLRLTGAAGIWKAFLAGSSTRLPRNQCGYRTDLHARRIFIWTVGVARSADRSLGPFVGALSDICWVIRGVSVSRLQFIYVEFRRRLLACCHCALAVVC